MSASKYVLSEPLTLYAVEENGVIQCAELLPYSGAAIKITNVGLKDINVF